MRKIIICFLCLLCGCGYAIRDYVNKGSLYIKPAVNDISIASEKNVYSGYTSYPVLIEKKFTNELIHKFNVRGSYSITGDQFDAFTLECRIYDYKTSGLRYTDSDDVTEQRLYLYVQVSLYDQQGALLETYDVLGETTYFLSGPYAVSEEQAIGDLIDDTARRVVDAVSDDW